MRNAGVDQELRMREVGHADRSVNDRYTYPLEQAHLAAAEQTAALVRKARSAFLGIFGSAFSKAKSAGRQKIDLHSVEEAARDWYETDKSTALSDQQRIALHRIITDVIGSRQTNMYMLARERAGNPMIQSLFDLRLIHLISRGYTDKENPGQRWPLLVCDRTNQ
jgi:hypothetical protein